VSCETDGVADQAFLNHLESLQNWKKRTLPLLMMPQGEEVVTWLMCLGHRPRPLKDLYANSRFSEPTIRIVIQSLLDRKLVVFYSDESDQRVRLIRATKKLVQILDEYVSRIQCCPQALGGRTLQ
jgi:DNA-binding MarR family transcriptional regulator